MNPIKPVMTKIAKQKCVYHARTGRVYHVKAAPGAEECGRVLSDMEEYGWTCAPAIIYPYTVDSFDETLAHGELPGKPYEGVLDGDPSLTHYGVYGHTEALVAAVLGDNSAYMKEKGREGVTEEGVLWEKEMVALDCNLVILTPTTAERLVKGKGEDLSEETLAMAKDGAFFTGLQPEAFLWDCEEFHALQAFRQSTVERYGMSRAEQLVYMGRACKELDVGLADDGYTSKGVMVKGKFVSYSDALESMCCALTLGAAQAEADADGHSPAQFMAQLLPDVAKLLVSAFSTRRQDTVERAAQAGERRFAGMAYAALDAMFQAGDVDLAKEEVYLDWHEKVVERSARIMAACSGDMSLLKAERARLARMSAYWPSEGSLGVFDATKEPLRPKSGKSLGL